MRLHVGELSTAEGELPETQNWQTIRSPNARLGYALAAVAGIVMFTGLCGELSLWSLMTAGGGMATSGDSTASWAVVLVVLVAYIPLHEGLHLLGQPGRGRSSGSVLVVWPAKLRFGVYYEGCMSRRQWLAMRLAPVIGLSVLPAALLALSQLRPLSPGLSVGLQVLMLVNTLGSGGDLLAVLLVVAQVPASGQLCFRGGRAYWRAL